MRGYNFQDDTGLVLAGFSSAWTSLEKGEIQERVAGQNNTIDFFFDRKVQLMPTFHRVC